MFLFMLSFLPHFFRIFFLSIELIVTRSYIYALFVQRKNAQGDTITACKTSVNKNTSLMRKRIYTGYTQKNGAVSKANKKFISHLTRAQRIPPAAATVHVSHALPAVRFSCLLRGRGASFQDGVAAGKGFLCAPFWDVQICDYSAAWVSCKF